MCESDRSFDFSFSDGHALDVESKRDAFLAAVFDDSPGDTTQAFSEVYRISDACERSFSSQRGMLMPSHFMNLIVSTDPQTVRVSINPLPICSQTGLLKTFSFPNFPASGNVQTHSP